MLKGSIVALVTPMCDDGSVDYAALSRLLEFHVGTGTHGIVALGTTGEATTLSFQEQQQVVETVVGVVAGRCAVYVGNGGNNTRQIIERTAVMQRFDIDGFLTVVPYYSNPTQNGLYAHFSAIVAQTDKPVVLYNVPSRTVADLLPETVERLAKLDNIVGIKEATGDLSRVRQIKSSCGENFAVLSGDDKTALDAMRQGADGVISVTANVAPEMMSQLCQFALEGDFEAAEKLDGKLEMLHQRLFVEPNPVPVKWALRQLGLINSDQVRLPLVCLEPIHQNAVKEALEFAGLTS